MHRRRPSGDEERIRRPGGGQPKVTQRQAGLDETLEDILEAHSAGSPTDETVGWTDLKPMHLTQELLQYGYEIGCNTAAKLLDRTGYRRRSLHKELITGQVDPHERDQQFRHLATGFLIPHGVYYYFDNAGFLTLGTSRKTSASTSLVNGTMSSTPLHAFRSDRNQSPRPASEACAEMRRANSRVGSAVTGKPDSRW